MSKSDRSEDKKVESKAIDERQAERERQRNESRTAMRFVGAGIGIPKEKTETLPEMPPENPDQDTVDKFRLHHERNRKKGVPSSRARQGAAELAAAKRAPEPNSVETSGGASLREGTKTTLPPLPKRKI